LQYHYFDELFCIRATYFFWVGLRGGPSESDYYYTDDTPFDFKDWVPGQPGNPGDDNGVVLADSLSQKGMFSYWDHNEASFVCKVASCNPTTVPTEPTPEPSELAFCLSHSQFIFLCWLMLFMCG
jgi:hypothetical protein